MDNIIKRKKFSNIPIEDPFFDTLKDSYKEFDDWYRKKSDNEAYVTYDENNNIIGFLYLKVEKGVIKDIEPILNTAICLKVGTFKINPHNTKLGERYIKKIFDTTLTEKIRDVYVTIFPQHKALIDLFVHYGFLEHGVKETHNGTELVYHKDLSKISGDLYRDYPVVDLRHNKTWLLSIKPEWHTKLFPDSILNTENPNGIVEDISYTNSVQKVYIAWMDGMDKIKQGDGIVIYRAVGQSGRPWFESVATSICTVIKAASIYDFKNEEDFAKQLMPYSVFSEEELRKFYKEPKWKKDKMVIIKMLYNLALPKRPTMGSLVEKCGLSREDYWGFREITNEQQEEILKLGEVYEGIVIN